MVGKRILIVEDDVTLSEMYKLKFQKEGFDVDVSENGFDALVKIQNFKPDVILLDIMMPDIDGFETLKVIREQTSLDTKIIMFSNLNRKDDIDKAFALGADDYLIKANVTPKEAVQKVIDMLSKSEQSDVLSEQSQDLGQEQPERTSLFVNPNSEDTKGNNGIMVECPHCHQSFYHNM